MSGGCACDCYWQPPWPLLQSVPDTWQPVPRHTLSLAELTVLIQAECSLQRLCITLKVRQTSSTGVLVHNSDLVRREDPVPRRFSYGRTAVQLLRLRAPDRVLWASLIAGPYLRECAAACGSAFSWLHR